MGLILIRVYQTNSYNAYFQNGLNYMKLSLLTDELAEGSLCTPQVNSLILTSMSPYFPNR